MDLKTYIAKYGADGLGKQLGKNAVYLRQIANGHRRASGELAIEIDKATSGVVAAETMRPDIDFAYLRRNGDAVSQHEEGT